MKSIITFFSAEMPRPHSYGLYHWIWIFITIGFIILIFKRKNKYNEEKLKKVLLAYSISSLIFELIKQVIWSYDLDSGLWSYSWYSAPFQLCTTPIYACLLAYFIKNKKIKNSLLSYMAYITILGSIATIVYPENCFVKTIEVNLHTMILHCGSFIVSIYLLVNVIEKNIKSFISSIYTFLSFETIALLLNIIVYNSNILGDNTFNMFYISPYFISALPLMNIIQEKTPYIIFLIIYNLIIILGGYIIYKISSKIHLYNTKKHKKVR